ncbi:DUF5723 family protein [Prevotella sp. E9-3]|uniref:DUF5723 family protein n=1 Tax=Prevotella sp. E9-3 TaxID=2913621 RepID=UPI001EDA3C6F|nr:DUF5723 family protein [Prevotella sp. E9-3]UKK47785.1 DUF5723 family protein [Prevotella sp. E9-3]
MKRIYSIAKRTGLFFFATAFAATASAQFLRTSYLQDVPYSLQMNPAQVPSHGYFSPLLGPLSVTMQSNAFGFQDLQDMFDKGETYYKSNDFMDKLKSDNSLNLNMAWDQINVGWFAGSNFWNFSTGTRIEMGASMPKSIFTFMNEMNGNTLDQDMWKNGLNADLAGEKINMMVYQEVGIGFARKINDKLTVGAKVKALLGVANMDFEISDMSINTPQGIDIEKVRNMDQTFAEANLDWSKYKDGSYKDDNMLTAIRNEIGAHGKAGIKVGATGKASMGGLKWKYASDDAGNNTYINGAEMNGFKISGYGLGLDLGATYEVMENLKVTAAVTDLGFINWSKSESKVVTAELDRSYDLDRDEGEGGLYDFAKAVASNEVVNFDMLKMKEDDGDGYSTSLYTTIALGGQYTTLDDKLVVGALYTGRMAKPESVHELTLSGAYNLSSMLNVAVSYSMIQSAGKSFGLGLKFGPAYIGTDYMFFGSNTKCMNLLAGLSIPLGKGKKFAM